MEANRRNWNERAPIHAASTLYDLAAVRAGKNTLLPLEREELGAVAGKTLLHLMCHLGTDSVSWARLGAQVTGVDQSDASLQIARELAADYGVDIAYVAANVCALPATLHGRFDIVVATYGITCWLPDIGLFCRQAAECLRPGGTFLLIDGHPIRWLFSCDGSPDYRVVASYFNTGEAEYCPPSYGTYGDRTAIITTDNYQWSHTLADIVTGVANAGLHIESLREFPFTHWNCYLPNMYQDADGWWRIPEAHIPLLFALRATKRA